MAPAVVLLVGESFNHTYDKMYVQNTSDISIIPANGALTTLNKPNVYCLKVSVHKRRLSIVARCQPYCTVIVDPWRSFPHGPPICLGGLFLYPGWHEKFRSDTPTSTR